MLGVYGMFNTVILILLTFMSSQTATISSRWASVVFLHGLLTR